MILRRWAHALFERVAHDVPVTGDASRARRDAHGSAVDYSEGS
jgi:hypothetical protein